MPVNPLRHKTVIFLISSLVFFCLAVAVWLAIPWYRGYSAYSFPQEILLARNVSQGIGWGMENDQNAVLALSSAKGQVHTSTLGNRLTTWTYAQIFSRFGQLSINQLTLVAVIIYALAMVLFAATVFLLFGWEASVIFYLLYIFVPFNWTLVLSFGFTEVATLFLSAALLAYFGGRERKHVWIYLILTGIFLGLCGLAKEAFLLFPPLFFLWLAGRKKFKELAVALMAFAVVLAAFWLPQFTTNGYALLFTDKLHGIKAADFGIYGEFFPDPYTYYYNAADYANDHAIAKSFNPLSQFDQIHSQSVAGFRRPSFYERLVVGSYIFAEQFLRFLSVQQFGGVLMFIFCLLGAYGLWQKKREIFYLCLVWIGGVLFLLSFVVFSARSHMMEMCFPLVLLMAYGVMQAVDYLKAKPRGKWLATLLVLLVIFNLISATKIWVDEIYKINPTPQDNALSEAVKRAGIKDNEMIAFGGDSYKLNYLTGKSFITFREETLSELVAAGAASDALAKFNVKYVLGYSPELTQKLLASSSVASLGDNSIATADYGKKTKRELLKFFR